MRRLITEKIPFLIIGLGPSIIGISGQEGLGALPTLSDFPAPARIANAILSYGQYLLQTVWPTNLAIYYPYPRTFSAVLIVIVGLLGLIFSLVVIWKANRHPYLLTGWIWYVIALLPAIGLIQVGGHARADRYTYVPLIGVFLLMVWAGHAITERLGTRNFLRVTISTAAVLICLGLSYQQTIIWKDSETLFRHALKVTTGNELAHNNLGAVLARQGERGEAIFHFRQAIALSPNYGEAHNNLAVALAGLGQYVEAINHFEKAMQLKISDAQTHACLGMALAMDNRFTEATNHFGLATELQPDFPEAYRDWGTVLLKQGQTQEAALRLKTALDLNPADPGTQCYYGVALASLGQANEGVQHLQEALRLQPNFTDASQNLLIVRKLRDSLQSRTNRLEVENKPQ